MASPAIEAALARMGHQRSRTTLLMVLRVAAIAPPAFYVSWRVAQQNYVVGLAGFLATLVILALVVAQRGTDRQAAFKEMLLPCLAAEVDAGLDRYEPSGFPGEEMAHMRLFERLWASASKDLVSGTIGGIPVRFAMVFVRQQVGPVAPVTFEGLVFVADFHKHFHGRTLVRAGGAGWLASLDSAHVTIEDPRFARMFTVTSTDQVEARYLLTPDLCERLLDLGGGFALTAALFEGGNVVLALDMRYDALEPRYGSAMDMAEAEAMLEKLKAIASLVGQLELDTRIWSKQGVPQAPLGHSDAKTSATTRP